MLSRGYDGALPDLRTTPTPRRDWIVVLSVPVSAALICVVAVVTT
jgi:hypothetical protein